MGISKNQGYLLIIVILLIGSIGYYISTKSSGKTDIGEEEESLTTTKTISIGTIGDNAFKEIELFQPTADYIAAKLSDNQTTYKGKVIIAKNFENISHMLKEQEVDLYMDSPFPTIIVKRQSGSIPFLLQWKNGVAEYHTVFFVKKGSYIYSIDDFNGKTIASEDPASTASYLMPMAYLIHRGFNINQSQKNSTRFVFSGDEENTPLWILQGKANVGAMNNIDFEKIPDAIKSQMKIIDRTIDVPRHIVSRRSDMEPATTDKIRQIFMDMDKDPQGIEILKNFEETRKYDTMSMDDLNNTEKMVDLLGY
jgi:phosphonate transport system substrate-binding protein